jgi:hypothetical protein
MAAPAGASHALQQAAWACTWSYLLSEPPVIESTDTADDCRPLADGAHPAQHEAGSTGPGKLSAGFEEDSRRDQLTSTAD